METVTLEIEDYILPLAEQIRRQILLSGGQINTQEILRNALTDGLDDMIERWNARNYPGTLQLCCVCDQPTGRCEDDAIYIEPIVPNGSSFGPFCVECYEERDPGSAPAVCAA